MAGMVQRRTMTTSIFHNDYIYLHACTLKNIVACTLKNIVACTLKNIVAEYIHECTYVFACSLWLTMKR